MPKGSCVCGGWTYEYEGEPAGVVSACILLLTERSLTRQAVCHCKPCQKTAGQNGSYNILVPADKFKKLSGTDFLYTRTGDSGKSVNYQNCGTCATVMVADIEAMPGVKLVKGGTLDDTAAIDKAQPGVEIYTKNRPGEPIERGDVVDKTYPSGCALVLFTRKFLSVIANLFFSTSRMVRSMAICRAKGNFLIRLWSESGRKRAKERKLMCEMAVEIDIR